MLTQFYFSDLLKSSTMELLLRKKAEEEARKRSLKLRALKAITLKKYAPEVRKTITKIIDELVCEGIFQIHMELKTGMCDPKKFFSRHIPEEPLRTMAEELDIIKANQDVNCPKCSIVVKCLGLSKHLAVCMNPQQSSYSYSSRNSSRIARQRIQEGFKTSYDESKNDSDDEKVKPKKRNNKEKKNKKKGVK